MRKYGKVRLRQGVLQKFKCMSCGHVWHSRLPQCIPEDLFDLVLEMLRTFIRDIEARKPLSKAGWVPLNEDYVKKLRSINFCEIDYENMSGRIAYRSRIPEELLLTDEGRIFCEILRSLEVVQEIEALKNNDHEYLEAVMAGLDEMFKNARLSFWEMEEGSIPEKLHNFVLRPQWNTIAEKISHSLTLNLLKSIWSMDSILKEYEEANDKSIDFDLLRFAIHEIEESSQWRKIIGFFKSNKDLLEALGLAWYVSQRTIDREIEYLGAKLLIFEAAMKIVAERNGETTNSLRDKLASLSENLDNLIFEEKWGVNWNDVFRLPY